MPTKVKVVLMAGGRGTRLWPKSRRSVPKQFISLQRNISLFQRTVRRVQTFVDTTDVIVVTTPEYVNFVQVQFPELPEDNVIVEPCRHSTTASLGYTLLMLRKVHVQLSDVLVFLPTDAWVDDDDKFRLDVLEAIRVARKTSTIVTLGVKPDYPATGYGYIEVAQKELGDDVYRVRKFVEKPSPETAVEFVQTNRHFWNAGIFVWRVKTIWNLLRRQLPEFFQQLRDAGRIIESGDHQALQTWYKGLPSVSFEYAVIEQATEIYMVRTHFAWTDLGSWSALLKHLPSHDGSSFPVVDVESDGNLIYNERGFLGLYGVHDLLVVNTKNALFICHRQKEQEIKQFLKVMEERGHQRYL
jgi:mannose-1-phosphate guanylyltransferase